MVKENSVTCIEVYGGVLSLGPVCVEPVVTVQP